MFKLFTKKIEIVYVKCPVCDQKNHEEAKECINCGADFTIKYVAAPEVVCDCKKRQVEYMADIDKLTTEKQELIKQRDKAKEALKDVELDKKITIEDIKHMQKMIDEKNELELEKKIFQAEKTAETEIKKIRKEYAEKLEKDLAESQNKLAGFMDRVMDALPNVNVKMKG